MMNGNVENNLHLSVSPSANAMESTHLSGDQGPAEAHGYLVP